MKFKEFRKIGSDRISKEIDKLLSPGKDFNLELFNLITSPAKTPTIDQINNLINKNISNKTLAKQVSEKLLDILTQ